MVDRQLQVWEGKLLTRPYGDSWKLAAHPYCCCFPFVIEFFAFPPDQDPPAGYHGYLHYQSSNQTGPFIWCCTSIDLIYLDGECYRVNPEFPGPYYSKLYYCTDCERWEFAYLYYSPGTPPNLCNPTCITASWRVHIETETPPHAFDMINGGSLFYDGIGPDDSTVLLYPCIGPVGDVTDCVVHYPRC